MMYFLFNIFILTAYVDNYCVWLNDVPTYTTTSRSHTKAATSRIQTASPRKEVPFGVYALLGVTVVVIGIVICFAIYRNAKCCNNKDSWNPDAERLLVTSPSGATAASSSSAAATPDHPLPSMCYFLPCYVPAESATTNV